MNRLLPVLLVAILFTPAAFGGDRFYSIPIDDLTLTEGELPEVSDRVRGVNGMLVQAMRPYPVLDGDGFAFVSGEPFNGWGDDPLLVRTSAEGDITGRLFLPRADQSDEPGMTSVRFTIPADAEQVEKAEYFRAEAAMYTARLNRGLPGAAWWRHQRSRAIEEGELGDEDINRLRVWNRGVGGENELDGTLNLFSGGRAMAENLALDRELALQDRDEGKPVKLDTIQGVQAAEIDWDAMMPEGVDPDKVALDPLARLIPHDQPVVFFPSVEAATRFVHTLEREAIPALQSLAPDVPSNQREYLRQRYEQQLGVTLEQLQQLAKEGLIGEIAVTASDPYLRTGTDLTIVMASDKPGELRQQLLTGSDQRLLKSLSGGDTELHSAKTSDRSLSAHFHVTDTAVMLSNSPLQLKRMDDVFVPITGLPEYKLFRDRYPRGEAGGEPAEDALLIYSDAAIRKLASPKWRIGSSRRVRAAAVLADLQADSLQSFAEAMEPPTEFKHGDAFPAGEYSRSEDGRVTHSTYNTLEFLTPIAELEIDEVTATEADAYERWRRGYESGWRAAFDPIAVRVKLGNDSMRVDASVLPLRAGSDYDQMTDLSMGVALQPGDGDPHETLGQIIYAINTEHETFREWDLMLSGLVPQFKTNPLAWVGNAGSIYLDHDEEWMKRVDKAREDGDVSEEELLIGMPIGVRVEVSKPMRLALFLTGTRAFAEQSAPGLMRWERREHKGEAYICVHTDTDLAGLDDLRIFYTVVGGQLTVSLNEGVVQRAMDRVQARKDQPADEQGAEAESALPDNVRLTMTRELIQLFRDLSGDDPVVEMQLTSWDNLPILNQWKAMFPERDPLEVHREVWGVTPVCPAGGEYVWDEKRATMSSTAVGSPAAPKQPDLSNRPEGLMIDRMTRVSASMGFEQVGEEDVGLRATMSVELGE